MTIFLSLLSFAPLCKQNCYIVIIAQIYTAIAVYLMFVCVVA